MLKTRLALALPLLVAASCVVPSPAPAKPWDSSVEQRDDGLQDVHYRGGTVVFRIPGHWTSEFFPEGGADFWDENGGSWTFRVSTMEVLKEDVEEEGTTAKDILESIDESTIPRDHPIESLTDGSALREFRRNETERGQALTIQSWVLCKRVEGPRFRIVQFSLTVLDEELDDPGYQKAFRWCQSVVRLAKVSKTSGVPSD